MPQSLRPSVLSRTKFSSTAIAASDEPDLPYHGGLLELQRRSVADSAGDRREPIRRRDVAASPVKHFLAPQGVLGRWGDHLDGDEAEDRGCIYAKGQQVEVVDDRIENRWPELVARARMQALASRK